MNSGEAALTDREKQMAQLIAQGLSNKKIGEALGLCRWTVAKLLGETFEILGISGGRFELVLYARDLGLVDHLAALGILKKRWTSARRKRLAGRISRPYKCLAELPWSWPSGDLNVHTPMCAASADRKKARLDRISASYEGGEYEKRLIRKPDRGCSFLDGEKAEIFRGEVQLENPLLSDKEREIIELVTLGLTDREMCGKVSSTRFPGVSMGWSCLRIHLSNIFFKLGVRNRTELACFAINCRATGFGDPGFRTLIDAAIEKALTCA